MRASASRRRRLEQQLASLHPRPLGNPLRASPALRPRRDLGARPLRPLDAAFRFVNSVLRISRAGRPLAPPHPCAPPVAPPRAALAPRGPDARPPAPPPPPH